MWPDTLLLWTLRCVCEWWGIRQGQLSPWQQADLFSQRLCKVTSVQELQMTTFLRVPLVSRACCWLTIHVPHSVFIKSIKKYISFRSYSHTSNVPLKARFLVPLKRVRWAVHHNNSLPLPNTESAHGQHWIWSSTDCSSQTNPVAPWLDLSDLNSPSLRIS